MSNLETSDAESLYQEASEAESSEAGSSEAGSSEAEPADPDNFLEEMCDMEKKRLKKLGAEVPRLEDYHQEVVVPKVWILEGYCQGMPEAESSEAESSEAESSEAESSEAESSEAESSEAKASEAESSEAGSSEARTYWGWIFNEADHQGLFDSKPYSQDDEEHTVLVCKVVLIKGKVEIDCGYAFICPDEAGKEKERARKLANRILKDYNKENGTNLKFARMMAATENKDTDELVFTFYCTTKENVTVQAADRPEYLREDDLCVAVLKMGLQKFFF